MHNIVMDEPLFLATAALWFNNKKNRPVMMNYAGFVKLLRCPSSRPYNPTGYICTYLAFALDGKRSLDDIFKFPGAEVPSWATKPAQLARVYTGHDGKIYHAPVEASDLLSGPSLGFNAHTRQDLHTWLTAGSGTPFCLCSASCNADLMFVLKLSNDKLIWVVLRTSGNGTADLVSPEKLQENVDGTLLENLFPALVRRYNFSTVFFFFQLIVDSRTRMLTVPRLSRQIPMNFGQPSQTSLTASRHLAITPSCASTRRSQKQPNFKIQCRVAKIKSYVWPYEPH